MKHILITLSIILTSGIVFAESQDALSRERSRVLIDTNSTTSVTAYSAAGAGQMLAGAVSGSNAVWIATAAGTNGWVKAVQK